MKAYLKDVRGIALEVRGISKSLVFNEEDITLKTLMTILRADITRFVRNGRNAARGENPAQNCFRLPCDNCRVIMPLFGIEAGFDCPAEYDKDMIEADVSAA